MFGGFNSGGGGFGGQQQQSTGFGAAPGGFGSTGSFGAPATGFGAAAQTTGFGGGAATTGFGAAPSTGGFGAAPASTGFGGGGFGGSTTGFGVQAQQAQPQSGFGGSSFGGAGATPTAGTFGGFGATNSTGGFGSGGGFGAKPATSGFGAPTTGFGAPANTGFGGASTSNFGGGGMNAAAGQGTANPPFAPFVEKEPATGQNSHYQSITAMPAYRGFSFEELRLQDYQQGRKLGQGAAGGLGAGGFGAATSGFGAQPTATGFGAQPSTGFGATNTTSTLGGFGAGSSGFGGAATGGGFGATGGFGSTAPATTGFGAQPAQTTGFGAPSTAFGGATATGFGAPAATGFGGTGGFGAAAAPKPTTGFGGFGAATSQPATGFGATPAFGGATTTPSMFGGAGTGTTGAFGAPATSTASTGFGGFGAAATSTAPTSTGLGFGLGGSTAFGAAKPATGLFGATPASSAAAPAFGGFGATPILGTASGLFGGATTGSSLFPGTSTATTGGLFGGAGATAAPAFGAAPGTSLFGASKPAATGGLFSTAPSTGFGASPFGAGATTQPSLFGGAGTTGAPFGASTASSFLGGSTATAQAQPSLVASVNSNIYGENPLFLRDSTAPAAKAQPAVLSRAEPAQKLPAFIPAVRFSPRHSHIRLRPSSTATFASSVNGTSDTGAGRKGLLLLDGINDDSAFPTDEYAPRRSVKKLDLKPRGQEDQMSNKAVESHRAGVTFNPTLETAAESSNRRNGLDRPAFGFAGKSTETSAPLFTTHETTSRQESSGASQSTTRTKPEGEYWMSPSLEELRNMSNAELKRVENFKVGLPEFGSVDFQMPVDLSLVPLTSICGNIVVFENKVCRVYPDETNKPPRGQGLNVPAIISLERCWPLDKTTQKPMIFDANSPMYAKHLKRLRRQSETTFIDFTTDNGTWTFRVEHFSEYGLYDDEDEEETRTNAASTSSSRALPVTNQGYGHVDTDTSSMSDSPITGSERMVPSKMVDTDMDSDSTSDVFHRQLPGSAKDPQRQYMMKMSLFPEDSHERKRTVKRAVWSGSPDFSEHEASGLGAEFRPSFQQDHEQRAPLLSRPPRKFFRSTYEESIMSRKGNLLADAGLMMGRSCRVGWGPNGMLAVCGTICNFESVKERVSDASGSHAAEDTVSSSTVKLTKVKVVAAAQEIEVARHITSLQAQLEHSKVVLDQKRLPRANITTGTSFSAMFHSLKSRQHPLSTEEINAWTLGHTLFDALPKSQNIDIDEPQELLEARARTIACGEWLSQVSKVVTEAELEKLSRSGTATALEDSVIALLVSNKRQRASIAAVQAKNPRLATLIAQTGRGSKSLSKVEDQLLLYKDQVSGIKIPDFYLKALALLSGALTTDIAPKGEPSRYVTDGLDWRRTLGLHLWYSNTAEVDLTTALNEYVESLSQSSKIAKPLPTYQKQGASKSEHYDFLFQLIKLLVHPSTQLETVLHPLGISPSRLDYRQSWQFYMVLTQSLGVASFGSDSSHAIICNNFMSQLENLGLWQWAVFIALHLESSESREAAVRSLLERHIEIPRPLSSTGHSSSIELEGIAGNGTHTSFLLKDLKIPEEWLWAARSTQANYRGDLSLEVYSLLKSGEYQKAHVLILSDLAPLYILYGGLETLGKLLGMVDQTKVANWANGGGVYQKYLECCSDSEGNVGEVKGAGRVTYASNIVYPDDIEAFQAAIRELLPKLPLLLSHGGAKKNTQMQEICVAEMVSKCTNMLRDLAVQENTTAALPEFTMSEDQCVSSIQKISTDYFDEILASAETTAY